MANFDKYATITQIQAGLAAGTTNLAELLAAYAGQIATHNPTLNAFITILTPTPASGPDLAKPLAGVTVALKDLFETRGIRTTAGAGFLRENVPDEDAFVVKKIKEAGGILTGKTNLHEIALGVTNNNPHYGACRNPWDMQRIPGGSSGGSAVAVATGMCAAALGSDTGGSIRIPSSLCGTVGLKPTYGRVSLRGVMPLSWNLDHAGPITRSVRDAAILLQAMAGYDPDDPSCADRPVDDYLSGLEAGVSGLRIAVAGGEYIEASQAEVLAGLQKAAQHFESLGARLEKVEVAWLREAALANGIMTPADGAALHHERLVSTPEDFGEDVLRRLRAGLATTSTEYARARRVQTEVKRKFKLFFEDYDLLILPTTPSCAPLIEGNDAVEQARMLTRFTAPFNLAGLPALSLPCSFSAEGLPIGLQLVGPAWSEARVLAAANAFERSTEWHERRPVGY
jgi:aspartyl-tRNA(Asn)/glutamyl-tRNA(Gln) amidotransferase subunit A